MAKVLVTGGSGYIGGAYAEYLIKSGYEVDRPTYRIPSEVYKFDKDYDYIVHFASTVHSYNVLDENVWDKDLYVNTLGTQHLLNHFKKTNAKLVYISTFFVNDGNPRCTYAVSKLAAEHMCLAYNRIFDMQNSVIRLPNVFGPGEWGSKQKGSLNWMVELLVRDQEVPLYGADYTREFLYIEDAVKAIYSYMKDSDTGQVWDVPGEPCTVHYYMELAQSIAKTGTLSTVKVPDFHSRIGPTHYKSPESYFAFKRSFSIVDGLKKLVNFYRANVE